MKAKAQDGKLRFMFVVPCVEEAFFNPVRKGMADAACLMDVECVFSGTADVDIDQQIEMVREAVAEGYDGIAVSFAHPTAFNQVVEETLGAGVPIIAVNVDSGDPANRRLSAVCQNLRHAGQILGAKVADFIVPNSKVLMTIHSEGISALEDRLQGMQDILGTKNITREVVVTGIHPVEAADKITQVLRLYPQIKTVLCTGQADTEGAGRAVEQHFPSSGFYVAGFDLSPEILRLIGANIIAFTIDQQPYVQGFYPVVQLAQYCRYNISPSSIDTGANVITKTEVDEVLKMSALGYR